MDIIKGVVRVSTAGYRWVEGRPFRAHEPFTYSYAQSLKKLFNSLPAQWKLPETLFPRQVTPCLVPQGGDRQVVVDCLKDKDAAYVAFAKLFHHLGNEQAFKEGVVDFASTYGTIRNIPIFLEQDVAYLGTPLEVWKEEVFDFWNCFELFNRLRTGRDLSHNILWYPDGVVFRYFANPEEFLGPSSRFSVREIPIASKEGAEKLGFAVGDVSAPARYFLRQRVRQALRFSASVALDEENHIVVEFHETLPLVWFQFAQLIAGQRRLIYCFFCGLPMDTTGRRSHLKGHLNCRKLYNVQEYRKRLRERQGTTLEISSLANTEGKGGS